MPAFNFQQRFAPALAAGTKRQTIRARRKHPPRVGQTAYLYSGLRTKGAVKIGEGRIWRVRLITICEGLVFVEGKLFEGVDLASFAIADGFENEAKFREFFGETFDGHVVEWEPL